MTEEPIRPINEAIKQYQQAASDAEWNGDLQMADFYWKQVEKLKKDALNGATVEFLF